MKNGRRFAQRSINGPSQCSMRSPKSLWHSKVPRPTLSQERCKVAKICVAVMCGGMSFALISVESLGGSKKGNKALIIGKWRVTKAAKKVPPGTKMSVEFTDKGRLVVTVVFPNSYVEKLPDKIKTRLGLVGGTMRQLGTYTVEGKLLKTSGTTPDGKRITDEDTIQVLNQSQLVLRDSHGVVTRMERIKKKP